MDDNLNLNLNLNQQEIFVLGNNYDGCLLTGDCDDRKQLTKLQCDFNFINWVTYSRPIF